MAVLKDSLKVSDAILAKADSIQKAGARESRRSWKPRAAAMPMRARR